MVESAALLVDDILPELPIRQWVVSFRMPCVFCLRRVPTSWGGYWASSTGRLPHIKGTKQVFLQVTPAAGAFTLIQRFGSALNLNLHFHMLLLDGIYVSSGDRLRFHRLKAPTKAELETLVRRVSESVGRHLERQGLLVRDLDNTYLALEPHDDDGLAQMLGSSITYRIAIGPRQGHKAFTPQTVPAQQARTGDRLAKAAGFSIHARVATQPWERNKFERLARYVTRPAICEQRLSLTAHGLVRYELKTPYRDGTTHVFFEPLDFMARLTALTPEPRVNLIRYHGVFAPNSPHRAAVTPARRGRKTPDSTAHKTNAQQRTTMCLKHSNSSACSTSISKPAMPVAATSRSSPVSKTPPSFSASSTISTGAQYIPRPITPTPLAAPPQLPLPALND